MQRKDISFLFVGITELEEIEGIARTKFGTSRCCFCCMSFKCFLSWETGRRAAFSSFLYSFRISGIRAPATAMVSERLATTARDFMLFQIFSLIIDRSCTSISKANYVVQRESTSSSLLQMITSQSSSSSRSSNKCFASSIHHSY